MAAVKSVNSHRGNIPAGAGPLRARDDVLLDLGRRASYGVPPKIVALSTRGGGGSGASRNRRWLRLRRAVIWAAGVGVT